MSSYDQTTVEWRDRLYEAVPYRGGAHQGAWQAGVYARLHDKPKSTCPYNRRAIAIVGGGRHIPTGERGFANAWIKGWEYADQKLSKESK